MKPDPGGFRCKAIVLLNQGGPGVVQRGADTGVGFYQ